MGQGLHTKMIQVNINSGVPIYGLGYSHVNSKAIHSVCRLYFYVSIVEMIEYIVNETNVIYECVSAAYHAQILFYV